MKFTRDDLEAVRFVGWVPLPAFRASTCPSLGGLRDVKIVNDESTGEHILKIEVRGKRGVGFCQSMPGAILPFERVRKRKKLKPTDRIFGKSPREMMNSVLDELNLKLDRDGHIRT